jgi:hypothetical protein
MGEDRVTEALTQVHAHQRTTLFSAGSSPQVASLGSAPDKLNARHELTSQVIRVRKETQH